MLEPETPERGRVIIPDLLLLGVEPHALADDLLRLAGRAPDGKGAFEAHGEEPLAFQFARAGAEGVRFAGGGVRGGGPFEFGRDVPTHVEALHFDGGDLLKLVGQKKRVW